jgi:hypothetical protein
MELDDFEGAGGEGGFQDVQGPGMGLVYRAVEPQPAGTDIGNDEGEIKFSRIGVDTMAADFSPAVSVWQNPGVPRSSSVYGVRRGIFLRRAAATLVAPDMPRSPMASLAGLRRRSIWRPDIVCNWARIAG